MTSAKLTSFDKIEIGTYLSETQYYKVIEKNVNSIKVSNERGFEFTISADIVEEGMLSANQFDKEVKTSRTEIINILENAKDTVFTVNFNKLPTDKSVLEKLKDVKVTDLADVSTMKQLSKQFMLGEDRTLIGHLSYTEPKMGRSSVIDLDIPLGQHRGRLVDHRTINWLMINNVKYIAK